MTALTRQPGIHGPIGDLTTTRGLARILLTDNPTLDQPSFFYTYVALAEWLPPEHPVAMFVTFISLPKDRREVNLIYADSDVRFDPARDHEYSVAVQIGKWLFSEGHLTHHSVDRNPEGDRWAQAVGGILPPLAPADDPHRGNPEATVRSGKRALAALNATAWDAYLPA
ncbi:hypothetical protein [Nocardioides acrostichi]|uniref:Uncharacterized protein n=1 Tax=Nocardioides acrostichi TaxID=2784339 RepID=A0A930V237_9ACTN|nr:hypothetical protein [Nocardioides acrostichi]MBF4162315.1 hypothetical protein [Nocardioides acrostichi]